MMNSVFHALPTTIFEVMSSLSRQYDAINLGQGFPDDPGPQDVRQKAADHVLHGYNQYPSMLGLPELRQAISQHYQKIYECHFDPNSEILVTSGATEALAASLFALIEPGDEVIIFQPAYDAYAPLVRRAGGHPKFVSLQPPHWDFSELDLEQAFMLSSRQPGWRRAVRRRAADAGLAAAGVPGRTRAAVVAAGGVGGVDAAGLGIAAVVGADVAVVADLLHASDAHLVLAGIRHRTDEIGKAHV